MSSDEQTLERELRMAVELFDPVPPHLLDRATAMFTWRTIDAELAELVYDSASAQEPMTVRGDGEPRILTFRLEPLRPAPAAAPVPAPASPAPKVVEIEIGGEGATRDLLGRVSPSGPDHIDIDRGTATVTVATDARGRFAARDLMPGPLRIRCVYPDGSDIVTDWISA
jgi:hypothetical protein